MRDRLSDYWFFLFLFALVAVLSLLRLFGVRPLNAAS